MYFCMVNPLHTNSEQRMDKYKHRVNFRLEKRKGKTGELPKELIINADITFGCKRIWYYTGYRIAESKWDTNTQRVKRNNFNDDGASAADINQRLVKIESAVNAVFSQLELRGDEVTPTTVREELKHILNEEKNTRLTVAEVYKLLIDERAKELKETPAVAQWTQGTLTKHKTMLHHIIEFRANMYFEDITDEMLAKFELYLIGKGLSNNYTFKSMKDIKTFLNWATKRGFNRNTAYQSYNQRFHDETQSDSTMNHFALTDEEQEAVMSFPTNRPAIDRVRDMFVFSCYTGQRFSEMSSLRWSNIDGDMLDIVAPKTNKRQRFALPLEAQRILEKYPKLPGEDDPYVFPRLSNQKFNEHLKEVGKLAGMTGDWIMEKQVGREKIRTIRPKYESLSSHCARRTFVTMCLRLGMSLEDIRAVTGHSTSNMMMKYVKFDDKSKREKMNLLNATEHRSMQSVFDCNITDEERIKLNIPDIDTYFEQYEGDTASAIAHLALLFHLRGDNERRAEFMKRLPTEKFNEVMNRMFEL